MAPIRYIPFFRVPRRSPRNNNLRTIDVDISGARELVVMTACRLGKSSLAFDTIYARDQRDAMLKACRAYAAPVSSN